MPLQEQYWAGGRRLVIGSPCLARPLEVAMTLEVGPQG